VKNPGEKQNKRRMLISILLAFVLHGLVFVAVQYGIRADEEEPEEQIGPIIVTLYEPSQVQTPQEQELGAERGGVKVEEPKMRDRLLRDRKTEG
jgi:hypothetical protein